MTETTHWELVKEREELYVDIQYHALHLKIAEQRLEYNLKGRMTSTVGEEPVTKSEISGTADQEA